MNCAKVRKTLPLLAGGEIDSSRRQETERHLTQCSACRQALKEHETLVELSRSAPPVEISDEMGISLVHDIIQRSQDTRPGEYNSNYRDVTKKKFQFGYRLAGVTAVVAIALIAAFIAFGTHFSGKDHSPGVEDYLLRSDLAGLCKALQDDDSRRRLLDESVSVDLLIQTVEDLQRNRTFHARIEHHIADSLREIKIALQMIPGGQTHDGSHLAHSPITCAKAGNNEIRFENILRTLRCLRRCDDRITVREILRGFEIVKET